MATTRLHSPAISALPARAVQRCRYAQLSRSVGKAAQMSETFMGPELRHYQATVAELLCEGRA